MRELTPRAILLGGAITVLFTAANVYFGLKVGLTFGTAIPAAVISMALLRLLRGNSIVENNIVQTIASAAGAVATMIFILPGLVMTGWWRHFPYWTTVAVCFLGGTLGVMLSVPLRRALVTGSDLPYPEGVAGAEVLRVGERGGEGEAENRHGLSAILCGSAIAAFYSLLVACKLAAGEIARNFRFGAGATGIAAGMQVSLLGVGHLIGLSAGLAMLAGMILSWGVIEPVLVAQSGLGGGAPDDVVVRIFSEQVRFVGAGTIAAASVWTLIRIARPVFAGIGGIVRAESARLAGEALALGERDIPGRIIAATVLLALLPIGWLLWQFAQGGPVAPHIGLVLTASLLFILIVGAMIGAVTGYMAGLIGTSNSPVSGVGIIASVVAALAMLALFGRGDGNTAPGLVAYTLYVTAIVFGIALIANDNLQDLKTGQLVGSTPWKQQVALVIGVGFGSLVVPSALELVNCIYGFAGAPGAGPNALPAPQASLISSLVKGVLGGDLRWDLMGLGAAIGVAAIIVDEMLDRAGRMRLPPLGVALGMYLPMSVTLMTPVGSIIGHLWDKRAELSARPDFYKRMGMLLATGTIVGDSLFGLAYTGLVAGLGEDPLVVTGPGYAGWGDPLGLALFAGLVWWGYRRTWRQAESV